MRSLALVAAALAEDYWTPRDLDDGTLRLIRHAGPFHAGEQAKLAQLPARFSRAARRNWPISTSASVRIYDARRHRHHRSAD